MDVSNREPPRSTSRHLRAMGAVAVIVVAALVVFVATGGWSDLRQGFSEGLHAAPGAPTTTR